MTPGEAQTLLQQAQTYQSMGRLLEAAGICQTILKSRPRDFGANYFMAILQAQQGDMAAAIKFFKAAVKINPDFVEARYNLAYALNLAGIDEEAEQHYRKILRADPQHLNAKINHANTLDRLGRHAEALQSYDGLIRQLPESARLYASRGNLLTQMKRPDEALADCDKAIAIEPGYPEAHFNRGVALRALKRFTEAIDSYDKAIALKPDHAEAWFNRGVTLHDLRRFDEAVKSYDHAITLRPDYAEAYVNRGISQHELKRFDEALLGYDKALAIDPGNSRARFARSAVNLLRGNFAAGWPDYEQRPTNLNIDGRIARRPLWLGDGDIAGKRLLIHCEQGLGDTIQFCRYLTLLGRTGADVLFAPQPALRGLMRSLGGVNLVDGADRSLRFDYHCPLLSLPFALKTDKESIPAQVPYLFADPQRAKNWADRLGNQGFKVGICWQGARTAIDFGRSFVAAEFLPLSQIPEVRLISLQKGEGEAQLTSLPAGMRVESLGDGFDTGPDAFLDTAAVMQHLDLIITSDTSIAHLAGALGRPAWVVLQHVPDWRWLLDRNDSPWYPTMRLFRQPKLDDWKGAFAEIEAALIGQMRSASR